MERNWSVTGLKKKCPRCKAIGEVFIDWSISNAAGMKFAIKWPESVDTNVDASDLFEAEFGCGYDD
jgi:hypothetical protein